MDLVAQVHLGGLPPLHFHRQNTPNHNDYLGHRSNLEHNT